MGIQLQCKTCNYTSRYFEEGTIQESMGSIYGDCCKELVIIKSNTHDKSRINI